MHELAQFGGKGSLCIISKKSSDEKLSGNSLSEHLVIPDKFCVRRRTLETARSLQELLWRYMILQVPVSKPSKGAHHTKKDFSPILDHHEWYVKSKTNWACQMFQVFMGYQSVLKWSSTLVNKWIRLTMIGILIGIRSFKMKCTADYLNNSLKSAQIRDKVI